MALFGRENRQMALFGREKRQNERIDMLERRVFLLEAQIDQIRAANSVPAPKAAPKRAAVKKV
jgi:hypothetical protein